MSSISIDVDLDEVFYNLSDKRLLDEVAQRKLEMPGTHREAITTAIDQIRRGDTLDAITTLEREFWPKWPSVEQSAAAYLKASGGLLAHNDNQETPYMFDQPLTKPAVTFTYRNWRGETRVRTVRPIDLTFEDNPHHNGPQWFLNAMDEERDPPVRRSFAVEDILSPIRHVIPVVNTPQEAAGVPAVA